MKFYLCGRGGGKSYACAQFLQEHPEAVLVTADGRMATNFAREFGISQDRVFGVFNARDRLRGRAAMVVIDNLDMMLHQLVGNHPIEIVTLNGENEMPSNRKNSGLNEEFVQSVKDELERLDVQNFKAPTLPDSWSGPDWKPPVPERSGREGDSQALPVVHEGVEDIQSRVIKDIEARREIGVSRYGTALQPNNGREALLDLYEELLDACMYLKQELVEREILDAEIAASEKRSRLTEEAAAQGFRLVEVPTRTVVMPDAIGKLLPPLPPVK